MQITPAESTVNAQAVSAARFISSFTTLPAAHAATAAPAGFTPTIPTRWTRWWKSPIAVVDYAVGSRLAPWREAWLPTERTITGNRTPSMLYGGTSVETALIAAHALAHTVVNVRVSDAAGRRHTVALNPAMAVLLDATTGAYWIAPLTTTVRSGDVWVDVPHTIDGVAFEGRSPWLRTPTIATATKDLVVIVGRDRELTPGTWQDAPDDSRGTMAVANEI